MGVRYLPHSRLLLVTPVHTLSIPRSVFFPPAWDLFLSPGSGDLAGVGPLSVFN